MLLRVLGFGTYDVDRHPRIGILLEGLRAHGDDVVEANCPLGFGTDDRVQMLQRPWTSYRLVLRLLRAWWTLVRESTRLRRTGAVDAVVVGYLGHFDVLLARLLFPRTTVVFDMLIFASDTATDRHVEGRLRHRLLGILDRLAVAAADIVMVDTDEHAELIAQRSRRKGVVVPVGAPEHWFATPRVERPASSDLRVLFYGLFTPLQGTATIAEALADLADEPGVEVSMVGTGQDHRAAVEAAAPNPRVRWIDWVDHAELPTLAAAHDVCLGIFGTSPKALRVVPNKVYQGAAVGCALVTSDTPPQRRALGSAALYVPPGDPKALADTLRRLAGDPDLVERQKERARTAALERFSGKAAVAPVRQRLGRAFTGSSELE